MRDFYTRMVEVEQLISTARNILHADPRRRLAALQQARTLLDSLTNDIVAGFDSRLPAQFLECPGCGAECEDGEACPNCPSGHSLRAGMVCPDCQRADLQEKE